MRLLIPSVLCASVATLGAQSRATVRDSAGIVIVENLARRGLMAFRVEAKASCHIHANGEDPKFDLISVPDAYHRTDGRIVLAEGRSTQLRFYDCDGTLSSTSGRRGQGPGEFAGISNLGRWAGDSLLVMQGPRSPMHLFDPGGKFVRTIPAPIGNIACCFGDASVIVSRTVTGGGRTPLPVLYARASLEGDTVARDTIAIIAASQMGATLTHSLGPSGRGRGTVSAVAMYPAPFGRLTTVIPDGTRAIAGTGETFEVRVYSMRGRLQRIIRLDEKPVRVTQADVDAYEREQLAMLPAARREARKESFKSIPYPREMPAYRRLVVDAAGRIWAEQFERAGASSATWIVFDRDGGLLGTVAVPRDARVMSIGTETIVLRTRDDDGFAHIFVHALR